MLTGDQALTDFIRRTIRQTGPVSFAWFMEQALYHPELGYYSSGRCGIGRRGDYFTNVSVGPLFGRLLAAQFPQWADLPIRPVRFGGWDNRTFHLGNDMSVRLPIGDSYRALLVSERATSTPVEMPASC